MEPKRLELKALRTKLDALAREQKSIPLTLENVDRKQAIQDEIKRLNVEFSKIARTIKSH